jgi:hypothetical protein
MISIEKAHELEKIINRGTYYGQIKKSFENGNITHLKLGLTLQNDDDIEDAIRFLNFKNSNLKTGR